MKHVTDKNVSSIIGCTSVFGSKGMLYVKENLQTRKVTGQRSEFPQYTIVGDDNKGNLLLTSDGLWVSAFPKKLTRII